MIVIAQDQQGAAISFRLLPTTPLYRLIQKYNVRQGYAANSTHLRFYFDGGRLRYDDTQTPETFDMEDEEVIDVSCEVTGGSSLRK
eukprot:3757653-Prymnesium_polylepis.1